MLQGEQSVSTSKYAFEIITKLLVDLDDSSSSFYTTIIIYFINGFCDQTGNSVSFIFIHFPRKISTYIDT